MRNGPSLCFALLLCGCGGRLPERSGYLFLTEQARHSGLSLSTGSWSGAPVTPIVADLRDQVRIESSSIDQTLRIRPEAVGIVSEDQIEWLDLGRQARSDRVLARGRNVDVEALASKIGGEASEDGELGQVIQARDILDRLAFLDPGQGIEDLSVDHLGALDDRGLIAPLVAAGTASANRGADPKLPTNEPSAANWVVRGEGSVDLVGLYIGCSDALILDASGHFARSDLATDQPIAQGRYERDGNSVVLNPGAANSVALSIGSEGALTGLGQTFSLPDARQP